MISAGAGRVGNEEGLTVMVLDADAIVLPQGSVAVQDSVTVPPHPEGVALNVDALDVPVIRHDPLNPLVYVNVLAEGIAPQATVTSVGAVKVGSAAGLTLIVLDTDAIVLPQGSVADQVSVTVPPHPEGVDEKVDGLEVPVIKHDPLNPLE